MLNDDPHHPQGNRPDDTPASEDRNYEPRLPQRPLLEICNTKINLQLASSATELIPREVGLALFAITDPELRSVASLIVRDSPAALRRSLEMLLSISRAVDLLQKLLRPEAYDYMIAATHFYGHRAIRQAMSFLLTSSHAEAVADYSAGLMIGSMNLTALEGAMKIPPAGVEILESLQASVVMNLRETPLWPGMPAGIEEKTKSLLKEAALLNPHLVGVTSRMLSSWDNFTTLGDETLRRHCSTFFASGPWAGVIERITSSEYEPEETEGLLESAVDAFLSKSNARARMNPMSEIERLLTEHNDATIVTGLGDGPLESTKYTNYLLTLFSQLSRLGITRIIFSEVTLVSAALVQTLQEGGETSSRHSIATLLAEFLTAPPNANLPLLRDYLSLSSLPLDDHSENWLAFMEKLRPFLSGLTVEVTPEIDYQQPESKHHTVWVREGLIMNPMPSHPCIRLAPLAPRPPSPDFLPLMQNAAFEVASRYGLGDDNTIGIDQTHAQNIFRLTPISHEIADDHPLLSILSCGQISLWVYIAVDDDESSTEEPILFDVGVPSGLGR